MASSENFDPGRVSTSDSSIFGIRMTLPSQDTFTSILGDGWETVRWYASQAERDAALATIGKRHLYSRIGDSPTLNYEAIEAPSVDGPVLGMS